MIEALLVLFLSPWAAGILLYVIVFAADAIIGFAGDSLDD
jgi:hypothetical protein